MRAAILGGTFNPVHLGHLFLADEVMTLLGFDTIFFVPANIPAHKEIKTRVEVGHRLNMLKAAINPFPEFHLETCEIERGGISFSIDTVRHIKATYHLEAKPGFILGDDLTAGFRSWKNADGLAAESQLVVAHRDSGSEQAFPFPHEYLNNPLLVISSTMVRDRIRKGRAYRFLLPYAVWKYIQQRGLYRDD